MWCCGSVCSVTEDASRAPEDERTAPDAIEDAVTPHSGLTNSAACTEGSSSHTKNNSSQKKTQQRSARERSCKSSSTNILPRPFRTPPEDATLSDDIRDNLPYAAFSVNFRDPRGIALDATRLVAEGLKGWSTVLGTHGASCGAWYFEVCVVKHTPAEHMSFLGRGPQTMTCLSMLRAGVSTRAGRFDMPIGSNTCSYAVQLGDLALCHAGKVQRHTKVIDNTHADDVIGVFLQLPEPTAVDGVLRATAADPRGDLSLHGYLDTGHICDPDNPPLPVENPTLSRLDFAVNGKLLAVHYSSLYQGFFYPAVALYMGMKARINFGPHFQYNIPPGFRPAALMRKLPY